MSHPSNNFVAAITAIESSGNGGAVGNGGDRLLRFKPDVLNKDDLDLHYSLARGSNHGNRFHLDRKVGDHRIARNAVAL